MKTGGGRIRTRSSIFWATRFGRGDRRIARGRFFINFSPASVRQGGESDSGGDRSWNLHLRSDKRIEDLSRMFNPIIRGWLQYYGRFSPVGALSADAATGSIVGPVGRPEVQEAAQHLRRRRIGFARISRRDPKLWAHWQMGVRRGSMGEPYERRRSSTVLREPRGEDSPGLPHLEARCLPARPSRAAPYHTSLVSTPKLVLMLFEGNTHMFRQFFVDGSDHPKDLKPTWYGDSRAHWDGRHAGGGHHRFQRQVLDRYAGHPQHSTDAPDRALQPPQLPARSTSTSSWTIPAPTTKPWIQKRSTTLETKMEMTGVTSATKIIRTRCIWMGRISRMARITKMAGRRPAPLALLALSAVSLFAQVKAVPEASRAQSRLRRRPVPRPRAGRPRWIFPECGYSPAAPNLPSDPAYTPSAKKLYDQRKAGIVKNAGKDDPSAVCLPNGTVRVNGLPYKIAQTPRW